MKKSVYFLFAAVLLFGMVGGANANQYNLIYTTPTSPDNDLSINGSSGTAFTVTGSSTATAASIFDSATLTAVFDSSGTASSFAAWFDSARGQTPSLVELGASVGTTVWPGETGTHYLVTFNNFPTDAYFGGDTWYANSLVMGISYDSTSILMDGATVTVNYHNAGVPEPTTLLLLGLGLIGVAGVRRKFKK